MIDSRRLDFDRKVKCELHDSATSDTGLLAYREMDKVLASADDKKHRYTYEEF